MEAVGQSHSRQGSGWSSTGQPQTPNVPQGPYEGMPPEPCSGHSQLTPGPLWTFPTVGTSSSKELSSTSCLGPQPNCTCRLPRPGFSFQALT